MKTSIVAALLVVVLGVLATARFRSISFYRFHAALLTSILPLLPIFGVLGVVRYVIMLAGLAWLATEEGIARNAALNLPTSRPAWRLLALLAAFVTIGCLLFPRLDMAPGWTQTWESEVIDGFMEFARRRMSAWEVLAENLRWNLGTVTTGHHGLFYGPLTQLMFDMRGYSELSLRLPAALLDIAALAALYAVVALQFNPVVGVASALFFATNESVLFHGGYGTSLSGTFLALILAYGACASAATSTTGVWWRAVVAALALYASTLQYAAARLAACALAILTPLGILRGPASRRDRMLACGCYLVALGAAIGIQASSGAQHWFFHARGEHIFAMLQNPSRGQQLMPSLDPGGGHSRAVWELIESRTGPQLLRQLNPIFDDSRPASLTKPWRIRPYVAPFVVFLVIGLAHSARRIAEWRHAALFAWVAVSLAALLVTNRVDTHRISVIVPPLTIWIALGAVRAARQAIVAGVSPVFMRFACAAVFLSVIPHLLRNLSLDPLPSTGVTRILADAARSSPSNVAILVSWPPERGSELNHRQMGSLKLRLAERRRNEPAWDFEIIFGERLSNVLEEPVDQRAASELADLLDSRILFMAPADRFRGLARDLLSRGAVVELEDDAELPILVVRARSTPRIRGNPISHHEPTY